MPRVIKVKNPNGMVPVVPVVPVVPLAGPEPVQEVLPQAAAQEKPKRSIKIKKGLPVPPPPAAGVYVTKAMEAFEAMREYYETRDLPIPDDDIKWYHEELAREEAEMKAFWDDCCVTKAVMEAVARGATDDEIWMAEAKAKLTEKKKPLTEADLGEMPAYGSPEFWAWCRKRKQIRLEKEAAIIAAGGTVKAQKPKAKKV
jgi:hypothetical protein